MSKTKGKKFAAGANRRGTLVIIAAAVIILLAIIITAAFSGGGSGSKHTSTGSDIVTQDMLDELLEQAEEANE